MNILFLTLSDIRSIESHGIYSDLLREFVKNGDDVYIMSVAERKTGIRSGWIEEREHSHVLKIKTGNIQKTKFIEKGISTVLLGHQLRQGAKKYLNGLRFDLIMYSTPPVTIADTVAFLKRKYSAKTYLLQKDITPQTFIDLGVLPKSGIKGTIYKYFLMKEKKLYRVSDIIGCTSQANIDYIVQHNPQIEKKKVRYSPNAIEVQNVVIEEPDKITLREKYGIPQDKMIFVYGGNLGVPQDVPFILDIIEATTNAQVFFLIVGSGTEYQKIEKYIQTQKPNNLKLMRSLPHEEYDRMLACCDVGLVFLNRNYTVPNTPSRILSYMQAHLPVLACIDRYNDLGDIILSGDFGWYCYTGEVSAFEEIVQEIVRKMDFNKGNNGYRFLCNHYTSKIQHELIMKQISEV